MSASDVRSIALTVAAVDPLLPAAGYLVNLTSADGLLDTQIEVAPTVPTGTGNLQRALQAWNSGAAISRNGLKGKLYFMGGGHSDYPGNEVYEYDVASRTWARIWGPSANLVSPSNTNPFDGYVQYPDGAPGASHTYDNLVAIPPDTTYPQGRLILTARAYAGLSAEFSTQYSAIFNVATRTWTRSTNAPSLGEPTSTSIYDPVRHQVWRFGRAGLTSACAVLNLDTYTWGAVQSVIESGSPYINFDIVSGWCDTHGVIVQRSTYGGSNQILVFDPATRQRTVATTTGTGPTATDQTGLEWCPDNGKFYCYEAGSSSVWTLTPPGSLPGTWTWALETFAGGSASPSHTPPSGVSEATTNLRNNRWRYLTEINCFGWYDNVNAPVQLYKPVGVT